MQITSRAVVSPHTALVRAAAAALSSEGWSTIRARACPEYGAPQPVVVPVLNEAVQPDLCASHPGRRAPLLACVGDPLDLERTAVGRRWRALAAWATFHHAKFRVFVRPQDYARACAIAAKWKLSTDHLRALGPQPSVSVTSNPK